MFKNYLLNNITHTTLNKNSLINRFFFFFFFFLNFFLLFLNNYNLLTRGLPQISHVILFLTLYPPVVYSINDPLSTSQSIVTLTRLIPKSKNKTDQTLLSPSNTHSLSNSCLLTH